MKGRHRARRGRVTVDTLQARALAERIINVFDMELVVPRGTHVAAHCLSCQWTIWTYRNTDDGVRLLRRQLDRHVQEVHESVTQMIPVVRDVVAI